MATLTTNYQLKKPATSDSVSIADINNNMDIIDTQIKSIDTQINTRIDTIENTMPTKLDKLTYEWNKQVAFGSTGKLLLYKGRCYDTNITIDIDTTTGTTYHATFVVATQNSQIMKMTVYGDPTNTVGNSLYVVPCTGQTSATTETIEIYMSPQSWSKNLISIRAVAPRTAPTNVCENVSSIPSTATSTYASGAIVNALDLKVSKSGGVMTGALVAQTNTDYATAQMRNVIISTSDPSGGSSGDIWIKYA